MDDQKIEVICVQAFENVKAGFFCFLVTLLPWSNFACNEQFASIYFKVLEHSPDLLFVFIYASCVDVRITNLQRVLHCLVAFLPSNLVSPKAYVRDFIASIEFSRWILNDLHPKLII
jgi:hypothetical protein